MKLKKYTKTERIGIRVTPEQKAAIAKQAGDIPITKFILNKSLSLGVSDIIKQENIESLLIKALQAFTIHTASDIEKDDFIKKYVDINGIPKKRLKYGMIYFGNGIGIAHLKLALKEMGFQRKME